jgi:hypothetical protein
MITLWVSLYFIIQSLELINGMKSYQQEFNLHFN